MTGTVCVLSGFLYQTEATINSSQAGVAYLKEEEQIGRGCTSQTAGR